jgi:hypothetical protein
LIVSHERYRPPDNQEIIKNVSDESIGEFSENGKERFESSATFGLEEKVNVKESFFKRLLNPSSKVPTQATSYLVNVLCVLGGFINSCLISINNF